MAPKRDIDIILFGATGYQGALVAEYISHHSSTKLKWALAGRSTTALTALGQHLREVCPDRVQPELIAVDITGPELLQYMQRARVVINGVGPYHRYSEPILRACANDGTHYVDFCTETPWIGEMIEKYHEVAVESGAMIISAISNSSSPSDLVAWLIATSVKGAGGPNISEVVSSSKLELTGMSGGSFLTVLSTAEKYGVSWLFSPNPEILSTPVNSKSLKTPGSRLLGYRRHPELGQLTTSFVAASNEAIVHRSARLDPDLYGEDFSYHEYLPVAGVFYGIFIHLLTKFGIMILGVPFMRLLLQKLSFDVGSGPDIGKSRKIESAEFKAVGSSVDGQSSASARFYYKGALSDMCSILAVEAATVLLHESTAETSNGGGGYLTPSSLGAPYVERLKLAGVTIEADYKSS